MLVLGAGAGVKKCGTNSVAALLKKHPTVSKSQMIKSYVPGAKHVSNPRLECIIKHFDTFDAFDAVWLVGWFPQVDFKSQSTEGKAGQSHIINQGVNQTGPEIWIRDEFCSQPKHVSNPAYKNATAV